MKIGIIGAIAGLAIGVMMGAGPFGAVGGAIGAFVGAVTGFGLLSFFTLAAASAEAKRPHAGDCPEFFRHAETKHTTRSTALTMAGGAAPEVKDCSLWPEHADCGRSCVDKFGKR